MPRKPPASIPDDGMNRTTSLEMKRGRNDAAFRRKASIEQLHAYTLALPASLDVPALEKAIAEAERSDVDKELISSSKKQLDEAKKVQARKERERRIRMNNKRREEMAMLLKGYVNVAPLEVDLKAFGALLEECDVLAEAESDGLTEHVDEKLVHACREKYTEAEKAYAGKRKESVAELEQLAATVLTADPEALRAACTSAEKWGVAETVLKPAHVLLAGATRRELVLQQLESAIGANVSIAEVDMALLRKMLDAAASAAAPADALLAAARRLRQAEEAQAPMQKALKRLKRVLAFPAESLDSEAVRAAKVDAVEAFVSTDEIAKADAALLQAANSQLVRDAATVSLLALAAPTQPTCELVLEFKSLLEKAAAARVPEDVIKLATVCADEAESAELTQNDTYANASLCARIKAASERTALVAPAKKDATEAAARAAADIANLKADEAAAERSKLGEAVMSCTRAWEKVKRADDEVRRHQEDASPAALAVLGEGTALSKSTRMEAIEAAQAAWATSEGLRQAALGDEAKLYELLQRVEKVEQVIALDCT